MTERKSRSAQAAAWDTFYKNRDIPWQSDGLSPITKRYLRTYARGTNLLEIGCGTGEESAALRSLGFLYRGFDISEEAVRLAKQEHPLHANEFFRGDLLRMKPEKNYAVIYDKGVYHNARGERAREKFARGAVSMLRPGGIWISVCGSADFYNPDIPHGAVFLQHLIAPAELYFEVLEIVKAPYGTRKGRFDGWYCLFRRR